MSAISVVLACYAVGFVGGAFFAGFYTGMQYSIDSDIKNWFMRFVVIPVIFGVCWPAVLIICIAYGPEHLGT